MRAKIKVVIDAGMIILFFYKFREKDAVHPRKGDSMNMARAGIGIMPSDGKVVFTFRNDVEVNTKI